MSVSNVISWTFLLHAILIHATWIYEPGYLHIRGNDGFMHTLSWLVVLNTSKANNHSHVTFVAERHGLINLGQVLWLEDHFFFVHPAYRYFQNGLSGSSRDGLYKLLRKEVEEKLTNDSSIVKFHVEVFRQRSKREFVDPFFDKEWYLRNSKLNVTSVWERNITGRGVTVCIVDDGVDWTNPDLKHSYNPSGSYDIISNDGDPTPDYNNSESSHGTRCAGEVVAAPNKFCGVGISYGAKFSAIRILDNAVTDSMEAKAFSYRLDVNDIYSCSWGPLDDGATIEGPQYLTERAMKRGIEVGRGGYGVIYVVASGNGRESGDNCNFDGFASSPYTITIGALNQNDYVSSFSEACTSVNAVAYGQGHTNSIVTTDIMPHADSLYFSFNTGCTSQHKGTSAAAPQASAMIALMLEVNPCLSWRDVQYIIMFTSEKLEEQSSTWVKNAAGVMHSSLYGFGKLNAWYLTNIAKVWESVPWHTTYSTAEVQVGEQIPAFLQQLNSSVHTNSSATSNYGLIIIEKIQVSVTMSYPNRGKLQFALVSPSGTNSIIAEPRSHDTSINGYHGWKFTSLQFWGEQPNGKWTLVVTSKHTVKTGMFHSWFLVIYGTPMSSEDFQAKKLFVEMHKSHDFLSENVSGACQPPLKSLSGEEKITSFILRILVVAGLGLCILAIWEVLDSMFCKDDDSSSVQYADEEGANEETKLILDHD